MWIFSVLFVAGEDAWPFDVKETKMDGLFFWETLAMIFKFYSKSETLQQWTYLVVNGIVAVLFELKQQLIEEVVREPDGSWCRVEWSAEAEEFRTVTLHGVDVLASQLRCVLEVSVNLINVMIQCPINILTVILRRFYQHKGLGFTR